MTSDALDALTESHMGGGSFARRMLAKMFPETNKATIQALREFAEEAP